MIALDLAAAEKTATTRPARREHVPGDGPRRRSRPQRRALSDEQVAELRTSLKNKRPSMFERLEKTRQTQPDAYSRYLRFAWRGYQKWKDLPPEIQTETFRAQDAKVRIWRLVKEYHKATDAERTEELRGEIHQAMGRLHDAEQKLREHRLKQLTEQLGQLRRELAERNERRDEIIERRVQDRLKAKPPSKRADKSPVPPGPPPSR